MRIFITGASGFIGTYLMDQFSDASSELLLLAQGRKDCEFLSQYKARVLTADLKDISGIRKDIVDFNPQVCIHLAWTGIPDYSFQACRLNMDNSVSLVNLVLNETACEKIIISGSCLEYGRSKGECTESDSVNIDSFFAWAKYSLCSYVSLMCEKSGKDLIWFRKFYVYGNKQRKRSLIPTIASAFKSHKTPEITNPFNANDFIHVKDIARAIRMAADKKITPGIYNLGSGKSSSVIDICRIVEQLLYGKTDFSDRLRFSPGPTDAINFWADISKARKNLSWEPEISVEEGIKEYLKEDTEI